MFYDVFPDNETGSLVILVIIILFPIRFYVVHIVKYANACNSAREKRRTQCFAIIERRSNAIHTRIMLLRATHMHNK